MLLILRDAVARQAIRRRVFTKALFGLKEGVFMLSHMVYFTLKDSSTEACQTLVDACHKYLKPHSGIAFYAAGTRGAEFDREVNDVNFHVALNVVFDSKESHDAYQVSEPHLAFIEEGKGNWDKVRIFDAYVE